MKKKSTPFDKFTKRKSNAAIKEQFRQEKRKIKKEREEYFEKKKSEVRGQRLENSQQSSATGHRATAIRSPSSDLMPLNKFIAHAGVSGRREAAETVKKGLVKVNGEIITEPGHKVSAKDEVKVNGKKIFPAKNLVYILLNKPKDKTILGVEIHSGRNRIVRRIFEHLGYDVRNLDRVIFAGLTKKNIERGKWRFLTEKEVRDLKYFGKGR